MSGGLHYRVSGRTIQIHLEGEYTTADLIDLLARALQDPDGIHPFTILVDARRSTAARGPADVRAVIDELTRWSARIGRMAVVATSDLHYGLARMGSTLAEDAGIESAAFREYAEALAFLDIEPDVPS